MSWKSAVEPVISRFPTIQGPDGHVPFKRKFAWTVGVLVLYFFLTNVTLFGLGTGGSDAFGQFRSILAGGQGTILQLGIGPIVTASIVLQLLTGADLLDIDKSDPRDKAVYQGLQKMLVLGMVMVQAVAFVFLSNFLPADSALGAQLGIGDGGIQTLLFLQVAVGGMMLFYMDEIVSKWGIGSGIGLFIIAGVSQQLIGGLVAIPGFLGSQWGLIPAWGAMAIGHLPIGIDQVLWGYGQLLPLVTTIVILGIVVYAESVRVEIPLKHGSQSGARGRYPVKLIYASVLPMILVRAVQANIQILGQIINTQLGDAMPAWLGVYNANGQAVSGLFWYLSPIQSPEQWMWWQAAVAQPEWAVMIRVVVDLTIMVVGGGLFAVFWVETADMGPKTVANNIQNSGMQIPGFRQHSTSIERVVNRYIPHVTVLGGAIVGFLAVMANMLGTIGGVTGTGLLLTVSITYKLYEQIAEEKLKDMHPMMRKMFE